MLEIRRSVTLCITSVSKKLTLWSATEVPTDKAACITIHFGSAFFFIILNQRKVTYHWIALGLAMTSLKELELTQLRGTEQMSKIVQKSRMEHRACSVAPQLLLTAMPLVDLERPRRERSRRIWEHHHRSSFVPKKSASCSTHQSAVIPFSRSSSVTRTRYVGSG